MQDILAQNVTGSERAVFARNMTGLSPARSTGILLRLFIDPRAFPTTMLTGYCDGVIIWSATFAIEYMLSAHL